MLVFIPSKMVVHTSGCVYCWYPCTVSLFTLRHRLRPGALSPMPEEDIVPPCPRAGRLRRTAIWAPARLALPPLPGLRHLLLLSTSLLPGLWRLSYLLPAGTAVLHFSLVFPKLNCRFGLTNSKMLSLAKLYFKTYIMSYGAILQNCKLFEFKSNYIDVDVEEF